MAAQEPQVTVDDLLRKIGALTVQLELSQARIQGLLEQIEELSKPETEEKKQK